MSKELVCPYCGGILEQSSIFNLNSYACTDLTCKGYYMTATKDMWQELIRTRKALEIAWDALIYDGTSASKAAIDKIKVLAPIEQKDEQ